jgi:ketol-acid reductoisomerase
LIGEEVRKIMKKHLEEIRSGAFAREWDREMENGYPVFKKLVENSLKHPINEVEEKIRKLLRR